MKTINSPNGAYISLHQQPNTFSIQLHRYQNIHVVLDRKVIPQLILALKELQDDSKISPTSVSN